MTLHPPSGYRLQTPVVVRSPNWLGDAVMALPAVRNLRTFLPPGARLDVAVPAKLAALWDACPFVDHVLEMDEPKKIPLVAELLQEGEYQTAVLLPNSLRVAAEAFSAGIPHTVAYPGHARRWLISQLVEPAPFNALHPHQKYYYLDLIEALGAPADASCPDLVLPADFQAPDLPGDAPLLVLCPGAEYGPAKRWPAERFSEVANHMRDRHGARVVVAGAKGDADVAAQVAAEVEGAVNLTGRTSLEEFMRLLAMARVVVGNDSGSMHLASALGTPVVGIFGSTEPRLTGPIGPPERARVLRHHVSCSPCFLRECPLDFACMDSIASNQVLAAVEELWATTPAGGTRPPHRFRRARRPYSARRKAPGPSRKIYRA
ncbi:MAG: lipopolysaccharide heptosyltransferase II [Verrucomicrobiota bacterium]